LPIATDLRGERQTPSRCCEKEKCAHTRTNNEGDGLKLDGRRRRRTLPSLLRVMAASDEGTPESKEVHDTEIRRKYAQLHELRNLESVKMQRRLRKAERRQLRRLAAHADAIEPPKAPSSPPSHSQPPVWGFNLKRRSESKGLPQRAWFKYLLFFSS